MLKAESPSLEEVDKWFNSEPISLEEGRHVIYFWNFGCKCCRNRIEFFRHIHGRYSDVNVIGIHTPRFGFEKEQRNLEKAVRKLDIEHVIAHDSEGEILQKYELSHSNQVLIVEDGKVVHKHTQGIDRNSLLNKLSDNNEKVERNYEAQDNLISQKFLGYHRSSGLNEEGNHPGTKDYKLPKNRSREEVYLKGRWDQKKDFIEAKKCSEVRFTVELSELDLVADPNNGLRDIEIFINGKTISEEQAGEDVRIEENRSYVRINNPGIYNLVEAEVQDSEITLVVDGKTKLFALSYR